MGTWKEKIIVGASRQALVEGSYKAVLLHVGRRGHGDFNGVLLGSVRAAFVAHPHPVLIVHAPEAQEHPEPRPGSTGEEIQEKPAVPATRDRS
ncbi:hypothetical protein [Arthrobacter bambusae]|uniref:hypothetical protein n=1 Tax=Arthrobacter bambusae TaxID=1338426 RepID=UPI002784E5E4|nr:hypothetical protein [Arthrobacter bambusae]MDQ0028703.1 hypothetical protein [Arthrobacter bambusae]MDQ0096503.1 hypothetical protein [Arthrobacter bambusae]